tara:strand:- start:2787 stop:4844 length:2058 start_codon:yes stop_codon:yes gene_type:complete
MAEFLLELYAEEVPPNLQINARKQLSNLLVELFNENNVSKYNIDVFSTPNRLAILINNLPLEIKFDQKEIRGPKTNVENDIVQSFLKSHDSKESALTKKNTEKGEFYFLKINSKNVSLKDILEKNLPKILNLIRWNKSMKWANYDLAWGRPLRAIFAVFNGDILNFNFHHLQTTNKIYIEKNLNEREFVIKTIKDYQNLLKTNEIFIDQNTREKKIIKKLQIICSKKKFQDNFDKKLLAEVTNIVENPNILIIDFDKKFLQIPNEIVVSTLQRHQRFFPIFDKRGNLTNYFFVISNKQDNKGLIKQGNKRVVEARLSDAKFFWDRDKSKNLIKQIAKLKSVTFFEKIGTIYDKTQRLRKLAGLISDDLNINKEKVEIAASICKSDLSSELVAEYPDLQGVMGKYFALSQGFDKDVAEAISDHYLPSGNINLIPKKSISYTISIADKIDTLVGFFSINQKPTSSKDPFALRRSAIGLLKIIVENKLQLKLRELISYNIKLFEDQNVTILNDKTEIEILKFLKERMKNILKERNIKNDVIDASLSSHFGDNYLDLYRKNTLMNKYINKDIGKNAINSYKRAFSIIEKEGQDIDGRPDAVLFRKEEEKNLYEKINEIRKSLTSKEIDKNYENLLIQLSETKIFTDNFFDKVIVNDENSDIKKNRLELLKMYCNTFNNFINFSKLENIK